MLLARMARALTHHWVRGLAGAFAVLVALVIAAGAGGEAADDFSTPGTESQKAIDLFQAHTPALAGLEATLVFYAEDGKITDREKQAAVISESSDSLQPNLAVASLDSIHYVPCPVCAKLMNRVNFARSSGVILDICKADGVWFDREELRRVVEFVRAGGLEISRERDRKEWETAKRKKDNLNVLSGMAGMGLEPSPDDFRERLSDGSLLIDALLSVARFFLK